MTWEPPLPLSMPPEGPYVPGWEVEYQWGWRPVDPADVPDGYDLVWGPEFCDGDHTATYARDTGVTRLAVTRGGEPMALHEHETVEVPVQAVVTGWRLVSDWAAPEGELS